MTSRSHLSLDVGTQLAFQTTGALGEMRRALTDMPHEVLLQSELMKKINKLVGDIVDTRLDPETVSTLCNEVKRCALAGFSRRQSALVPCWAIVSHGTCRFSDHLLT